MKSYTLKNGLVIPAIGYGTYLSTEGNGIRAIEEALDVGYRYLDTASFYKNEEQVGEAIKASGIDRDKIQICSKLWKTEMGYENAKKACEDSLGRLQTEYLDLYLIHWPKQDGNSGDWKKLIQDTWKAMEELYEEGKVKAIGLSNFLPHHIDAVCETANIEPMVDQLELHVGYMQHEAVEYCRKKGMAVQAWSPLGRRRVLEEPIVLDMAKKYGKTPAQFLLGFLNCLDIMVIPKASVRERLKENLGFDDFEISDEDIKYLSCLPQMGWSGEHPDL